MPCYESVFITRQDLSSNQVDNLTESFVNLLQQNKGTVAKKEYWGLRTLAYPIKKNKKGHYVLFAIDAPAEAITELERMMRLNEDVIRFLTVKVEKLELEPSVMMLSRHNRHQDDDIGDLDLEGNIPTLTEEASA